MNASVRQVLSFGLGSAFVLGVASCNGGAHSPQSANTFSYDSNDCNIEELTGAHLHTSCTLEVNVAAGDDGGIVSVHYRDSQGVAQTAGEVYSTVALKRWMDSAATFFIGRPETMNHGPSIEDAYHRDDAWRRDSGDGYAWVASKEGAPSVSCRFGDRSVGVAKYPDESASSSRFTATIALGDTNDAIRFFNDGVVPQEPTTVEGSAASSSTTPASGGPATRPEEKPTHYDDWKASNCAASGGHVDKLGSCVH